VTHIAGEVTIDAPVFYKPGLDGLAPDVDHGQGLEIDQVAHDGSSCVVGMVRVPPKARRDPDGRLPSGYSAGSTGGCGLKLPLARVPLISEVFIANRSVA
jgi:hypothetical protein